MEKSVLTAILQHAADGIISIDSIGGIESVNPAACKIFGYAAQEMIGKNLALLLPPPDTAQGLDTMQIYRAPWLPNLVGVPFEIKGVAKDKSTIHLNMGINTIQCCGRNGYTLFLHQINTADSNS